MYRVPSEYQTENPATTAQNQPRLFECHVALSDTKKAKFNKSADGSWGREGNVLVHLQFTRTTPQLRCIAEKLPRPISTVHEALGPIIKPTMRIIALEIAHHIPHNTFFCINVV